MQPLKSFWNKPPSNPATFEQERTQKPGHETVSTLHWPKNDILPFFKFLEKKVFRLDKKMPAYYYTTLGVVICKKYVARPLHSFNKCKMFFDKPGNFFRLKFEKCSKVVGFEGGLTQKNQKTFQGLYFFFSESLSWWINS